MEEKTTPPFAVSPYWEESLSAISRDHELVTYWADEEHVVMVMPRAEGETCRKYLVLGPEERDAMTRFLAEPQLMPSDVTVTWDPTLPLPMGFRVVEVPQEALAVQTPRHTQQESVEVPNEDTQPLVRPAYAPARYLTRNSQDQL